MKYLVLGSNSFAGSTFVDEILLQDVQVIGISRSKRPHAVLCPYVKNKNLRNFTFHALDLNQHLPEIKGIIHQFKPNYVIDFAAQSMVAESWVYPDQWYTTNIVAKVRLHDYLRTCDFLDRYIRISTPEVYGHVPEKITEEQPFNPTTPYAVSQAAIDMSLVAFYKQYQFPVIFTRYANFYGSHQQLYRIIPRTIIYCLLGKKLQLHGGGLSERAFIHGKDVTHAIDCVLKNGRIGESYHFSSDKTISIKNLVKVICDVLQVNFDLFVETTLDRPGKDALYSMKTDKAENELQWSPKISLEQGLNRTIEWLSSSLDIIKTLPLEYIHKP